MYNDNGLWPQQSYDAHCGIGFNESSRYLIPVPSMRAFERKNGKYVKFAVWRNPVDRIVSTYKLFCLENEYRIYFQYIGIGQGTDFNRFMEFLRFEWGKKAPLFQDEHVRKQVDYYSDEDVDFIVSIDGLHAFLDENGVKFKKEESNKTHSHFKLDSPNLINEIKSYYADDFDIPLSY